MKLLITLGALLVGTAAFGGGVAYFLAASPAPAGSGEGMALQPAPISAASPGERAELADLRDEIQRLASTVRQLQMEVEGLRSAASREPIEAARESESDQPTPLAAVDRVQLAERVREVLDEERRREEQQAEIERIEREKQNAIRMAERIGERLGLAPSDQTLLANHLISAQTKRNDLMQQMRDSGFDREDMRSSFEQLRDWNNAELLRLFGPDVGAQISEQTNNMGGRGGFGGGPGAFSGQAGGRRGGGGGGGAGGGGGGG